MNVKINDKQQSDDRMIEEQQVTTDVWRKANSWRTAGRSLLTKFFADENFLLYSNEVRKAQKDTCMHLCGWQVTTQIVLV